VSGPKYRHAVDAIKSMIASGEVVGEITLGRIRELTGTTDSTARRTANELVAEGILENHPGAPYAVVAMPEEAVTRQADAKELRRQVTQLREEVQALSARLGAADEKLERIDSSLEDLHDKLGYEYATDGSGEPGAARRGRTG
jgi:DNA-binding transcriptional regulator YhcF (GntR family)